MDTDTFWKAEQDQAIAGVPIAMRNRVQLVTAIIIIDAISIGMWHVKH